MSFPSPVSDRAEQGQLSDVLTLLRIAVCIRHLQTLVKIQMLMTVIHHKGEGGQLSAFYRTLNNGDQFGIVVRNFGGA